MQRTKALRPAAVSAQSPALPRRACGHRWWEPISQAGVLHGLAADSHPVPCIPLQTKLAAAKEELAAALEASKQC